ncbi:hypothetical protein VTK73DRAFT_10199 [Phialemonium thermophilum]|uniref:HMG box domain-containing protein n=1 Tax=Phialemonium thermophilum TaxID=223376 RepID=A0ABR3XHV7_9PEZI
MEKSNPLTVPAPPSPALSNAISYQHPEYSFPVHLEAESQYDPLPDEINNAAYNTPATSPPTPSQGPETVSTRGGGIAKGASNVKVLAPKSARVQKPAPRRNQRTKAVKRIGKLEGPMSEMTKSSSIPVVDIDSYVNRSVEERRREVAEGKVPGKVKRPMNAFMLYRKAYQNRAKDWCSQHNHQIVSQVCGDSWPLEPDHIRAQFNEWAKIERENHQKAHPGYKFSPSKPPKSHCPSRHIENQVPDPEDMEWRPSGRPNRQNRMTKSPPVVSDDGYSTPTSLYNGRSYATPEPHTRDSTPFHNQSAFQYTNPGRDMPSQYNSRVLTGQHYQATQVLDPQRQPLYGSVEDILMHKNPSPALSYHLTHIDPGNSFMGHHPAAMMAEMQGHTQPVAFEQRIDPSLLHPDGLYDPTTGAYMGDDAHAPDSQQPVWESQSYGSMLDLYQMEPMGLDETLLHQEQTRVLKGTETSWQVQTLDPTKIESWDEFP